MFDEALRRWAEWVDSGGALDLAVFGALPVVVVLVVLVHELGHAVAALLLSDGLVYVRIGSEPVRWSRRIGRFVFALGQVGRDLPGGLTVNYAKPTPRTMIPFALAGPLANALLVVALLPSWWLLTGWSRTLLAMSAVASAYIAIYNLVPRSSGSHESDGWVARRAINAARSAAGADPLDPYLREFERTKARWFALYTNERSKVRTPERAADLSAAPGALGFDRGSASAPWESVWRLAFAGWCWREVERARPPRVYAELASAAGSVRDPQLRAGAIAIELLERGVELGLASPGADDAQRIWFLARAFHELPEPLQASEGLTEEQCRYAFRFGVALHDAERFLLAAAARAEAS